MQKNTTEFDAIVIGSGISGGWAAKELTQKGLKVLMLERPMNSINLSIRISNSMSHRIRSNIARDSSIVIRLKRLPSSNISAI